MMLAVAPQKGSSMNKKDRKAIWMLAGAIDNLAMAVRDASGPQVTEVDLDALSTTVDRAQALAESVEESGFAASEEEEDDDTCTDSGRE